jgi:hypothetical protein
MRKRRSPLPVWQPGNTSFRSGERISAPAPLQLGQAPSDLALNSAGFTPLRERLADRVE